MSGPFPASHGGYAAPEDLARVSGHVRFAPRDVRCGGCGVRLLTSEAEAGTCEPCQAHAATREASS